jgi:hypothetical protein
MKLRPEMKFLMKLLAELNCHDMYLFYGYGLFPDTKQTHHIVAHDVDNKFIIDEEFKEFSDMIIWCKNKLKIIKELA